MSKPLIANPKRTVEASAFHRLVFAAYGGPRRLCVFCGKPGATDAAHVIPRSKLGQLRYACVKFARPAHRHCHESQERGEIDFSIAIRRDAIKAHNKLAKCHIKIP
jgi:hypothetical protein